MYLITKSFKLLPHISHLLILLPSKCINIFLMPNLQLLLTNFNTPQILFQLPAINPINILDILQSNLTFLLQLSQLI